LLDAVTDGMKVRNAESESSSNAETAAEDTVVRIFRQNSDLQSAIRDQRIAGGAA
jgi:hypothetical protein